MKLYLQYTSWREKQIIREAASLNSTKEAEQKGWVFIGAGVFKYTYKKENIVIKFDKRTSDIPNHMLNELKFYKNTPRKYKKYLARIFGADKSRIIQRFVEPDPNRRYYTDEEQIKVNKIGSDINMWDYYAGANVIIDKNGDIVFYDFGGQRQ